MTKQAQPSTTSPKRKLEAFIQDLKNAETTMVPVTDIKPINHLQKRTRKGDNKTDAKRINEESKALVESIANSLNQEPSLEVTPIWMVNTPEGLKLVDGHHRLKGYQAASRDHLPAKVIQGSMEDAHLLADSANNQTQTVKVTKQELLEIAWASLKRLYVDGAWTEGYTNREFARTRNVAAGTIDNMVKRVKTLGEDASDMSWREARYSGDIRQLDAETRVEGWIKKIEALLLTEEELVVLAELVHNLSDTSADEDLAKNKAVKALSQLNGWTYNNIEHEEDQEEHFVF